MRLLWVTLLVLPLAGCIEAIDKNDDDPPEYTPPSGPCAERLPATSGEAFMLVQVIRYDPSAKREVGPAVGLNVTMTKDHAPVDTDKTDRDGCVLFRAEGKGTYSWSGSEGVEPCRARAFAEREYDGREHLEIKINLNDPCV